MEFTDKYYNQILECVKRTNLILELAYEGNIGLQEVVQFFKVATPNEIKQFDQLMAVKDLTSAWELVQNVVKVRLKGL
jgi:hypothetical protein